MAEHRIRIIDSHTAGEPTRVVLDGGPDLGNGALAQRRDLFQAEFDKFRSAIVNEPRGSDTVVGAIVVKPCDPTCAAGVIFFNNVGYLGMCGHGTIGLVATLARLGKISAGEHKIETPVGIVTAHLHSDGEISVVNVPSYRARANVSVDVPGIGKVEGDIAWGGNWFFIVEQHDLPLSLSNIEPLTDFSWRLRKAVNAQGFPEVDHIELSGPPMTPGGNGRNFVLCPGKAYDRSPCGTGTSAKLACLAVKGELAEGQIWTQESIIGSRFSASFKWLDAAGGKIIPTISGRAHVNAETIQILDDDDPFCWGITP